MSSDVRPNVPASRRRLLLAVGTEAMVREEESGIGSGRNEASVKAFATQSDAVHLHPTRIL